MIYQRKRFEERKKIEKFYENDNTFFNEKENKESIIKNKENLNENKLENKKKKLCPICGKYLDENHKTNLITTEEFEKIKAIPRQSYVKLLETNHSNFLIGEEIKKKIKEEFNIVEDIVKYKEGHHLICRNDIFFNNEKEAILALSSGYNIDCIENGIVLPTILNKNYEINWNTENKFRIMSSTKRQLHNGPHNMSYSDEELKKIPKQNYKTLVNEEFRKVLKKFKNKCFLSEQDKLEIKNLLNDLSIKIKKDIEKFEIDPKSCNYYVSKDAMKFAFLLTEKKYKFIKINFFKENINAKKYELIQDYNLNTLNLKEISEYEGKYNMDFLKFCADIVIFTYQNKLYFLKGNLDVNAIQPIDYEDYSGIFSKDRNQIFKFLNFVEKEIENKTFNIRQLITLRKQYILS